MHKPGTMHAGGPSGLLRLAMWSGPRNVSTALMRSWGNRADTIVVDEPFYAHYLQATGLEHPGRAEILAACETDWRRVARSLHAPVRDGVRIYYQKQMAHHLLPDMGREWLAGLTHAFLVREPLAMLASLAEKLPSFDLLATGLPQQVEIFDLVLQQTGLPPPVIDAADLLEHPENVLRALCRVLGVPFSSRMLSWPRGPRATDGVWAPHWYERVANSTGFEAPAASGAAASTLLEPRLAALEAQCRPLYERLLAHRLRA